jgi:hypothetical protein
VRPSRFGSGTKPAPNCPPSLRHTQPPRPRRVPHGPAHSPPPSRGSHSRPARARAMAEGIAIAALPHTIDKGRWYGKKVRRSRARRSGQATGSAPLRDRGCRDATVREVRRLGSHRRGVEAACTLPHIAPTPTIAGVCCVIGVDWRAGLRARRHGSVVRAERLRGIVGLMGALAHRRGLHGQPVVLELGARRRLPRHGWRDMNHSRICVCVTLAPAIAGTACRHDGQAESGCTCCQPSRLRGASALIGRRTHSDTDSKSHKSRRLRVDLLHTMPVPREREVKPCAENGYFPADPGSGEQGHSSTGPERRH